ncbi:hypothetical protein DFQ28_009697, partial [Apophysomyces sp. BC1034]
MSSQKDVDSACKEGLTVNEIFFPASRPLPADISVTHVRLSKLPILPQATLEAGLRVVLLRFGEILDLGLYTEPNGGFFMGNWYAVLASDPGRSYAPLSHRLAWFNPEDDSETASARSFFASWSNMPVHCRYCHEAGHAMPDCPKRPARQCWNCHREGHVAATCPRTTNPLTHKKPRSGSDDQQRKEPTPPSVPATINTTPPLAPTQQTPPSELNDSTITDPSQRASEVNQNILQMEFSEEHDSDY